MTTVTVRASGALSASQVQWLRTWQAVVGAEAGGIYKLSCRGQLQVPMEWQGLAAHTTERHGPGQPGRTVTNHRLTGSSGSPDCQPALL